MGILLSGWTFEPFVLLGIASAILLYVRGLVYGNGRASVRGVHWWQPAAFGISMIALVIALESPIDTEAERYLWVHMIQHELLTMIVAPLVILSGPLLPMMWAVRLPVRRRILAWVTQQPWISDFAHVLGRLTAPPVAWLLFIGDLTLWHLPPLYNLTLEHQPVHDIEHALFLGTALLFWAQVIPSRPLRPHLSASGRALFLGTAALLGSAVDVVFIAVPAPLYAHYADLPRSPGMVSPLVDQSIAGGVMNGVNMTVLVLAIVVGWRRHANDTTGRATEKPRARASFGEAETR